MSVDRWTEASTVTVDQLKEQIEQGACQASPRLRECINNPHIMKCIQDIATDLQRTHTEQSGKELAR